ncbi:MAG: hypothetical protein KKF77_02935 [Proteobacteria bacterium]|nr:hypothetical protein [Pseudomonadota bacterium]
MSFISLGSGAAARGLPVFIPYTEAAAAAAPDPTKTFVCEMTGGDSANETGVGGGLTGADLVLYAVGGPPGASGGFRALNGSTQAFNCTPDFAAAFLNNPEWTLALQFKSLTVGALKGLWYYLSGSQWCIPASMDAAGHAALLLLSSGNYGPAMSSALPVTASPSWICGWRKSGNVHVGWVTQAELPTGWGDFPAAQRACIGAFPAFTGTWTKLGAVSSTDYPAAFSAGTLVASKLGLTSAPI